MIGLAVMDALAADAAVAALVGANVLPVKLPYPLPGSAVVVVQVITEGRWQTLDGPVDLKPARVQVQSWSPRYLLAQQLAAACAAVMEAFRGEQTREIFVAAVVLDDSGDRYDPETKLHYVSADFLIRYA